MKIESSPNGEIIPWITDIGKSCTSRELLAPQECLLMFFTKRKILRKKFWIYSKGITNKLVCVSRGVMGWSAVCDCGIPGHTLTICLYISFIGERLRLVRPHFRKLALRNLYIQVMHNRGVPVLVNSFVCLCRVNFSRGDQVIDGQTYLAKRQVPPPLGASLAKRFVLPYYRKVNHLYRP